MHQVVITAWMITGKVYKLSCFRFFFVVWVMISKSVIFYFWFIIQQSHDFNDRVK